MESVSKSLEDVSVVSLAGYINARLSLEPTSNPIDICNEVVQKALCTGEKRSGIIQSHANPTVTINKPILPSVQPTNGCQYQYKRGDNRGKYCGRAVIPGTNYCSKCSNNKSVQNLKNQTVIPQAQITTIPQLKFSPQTSTMPNSVRVSGHALRAEGCRASVPSCDRLGGSYKIKR
jgi:predicted P-loop ATPase